MTELTDLNDTDALNTEVSSQSTEGNVANMGGMDNLFQATLGMLSRFRNSNIFRLRDNTDKTKLLAFDLSGLTTGEERTLTVPDASGTVALTSGTVNLDGNQQVQGLKQFIDGTVQIGNTAGSYATLNFLGQLSKNGGALSDIWRTGDVSLTSSGSGLIRFPNGLTVQWMSYAGGGDTSMLFPTAFTTLFGVIAGITDGAAISSTELASVGISARSTSSVTIRPRFITGSTIAAATQPVFIIAIGTT